MSILSKQDLHNLAMNIVGKDLKKKKYEFLAVNSDPKKNPQFIVQNSNKELIFVVVRVALYPNNPESYDRLWMESFKVHAQSKNAKLYYAGVGLANSDDMDKPLSSDSGYIIKYDGYKLI